MIQQKSAELEPTMLFVSYAPEDKALQVQLEKHLSLLQRQGLISAWHNRQLLAGTEYVYHTEEQLKKAAIILLLISADFLASDYCYSIEMRQALERAERHEAYVIPILLRPVDWHGAPFQHLPCLPANQQPITSWPDQDEAFRTVVAGIRAAIEQIRHAPDPYQLPPLDLSISSIHLEQFTARVNRNRDTDEINTIPGVRDSTLARPVMTAREARARERLLENLEKTWIQDVYKHSLYQEVALSLQLTEEPDAVYNPWQLQVQEVRQHGTSITIEKSVFQIYDEAQGSLLVLGEAGSGKTTLLLQLLQHLLQRARQDPSEGIPILFSLASWARQKSALADWLTRELEHKYQISSETGQQWITSGTIIPLLDGLDEVVQEERAACAQAIGAYRTQYDLAPAVVSCRQTDYQELLQYADKLKLSTAVVIAPLTRLQINHFLRVNKELAALEQVYQQDGVLQELAQTPLMLNILALTYHGKKPEDISLSGLLEEQRKQIFAAYVQRMFERRSRIIEYTPEQTIFWLSWLARQMQSFHLTEFNIYDINTNWLPGHLSLVYSLLWALINTSLWLLPYLLILGPISLLTPGFWPFSLPGCFIYFILIFFVFLYAHYHQRTNAREDQESEEARRINQQIRASKAALAMKESTLAASSSQYGTASGYLWQAYYFHQSDSYSPIHEWLLRSQGLIPSNYRHFLDYATERIFLRKIRNRYMFIHRYLLEYFAQLQNE